MSNQKLIIVPEYTRYNNSASNTIYTENSPLAIHKVDTFSLQIEGFVNIDGIDETISTYIDNKPLDGVYNLIADNYRFICKAELKLHLYRKYLGKDCQVTYEYIFRYFLTKGKDITLDITDGKNHPRVQLCGKNAVSYRVCDISYIGKGSNLRNFKRNLRGIFLTNYVSLRKIKPY